MLLLQHYVCPYSATGSKCARAQCHKDDGSNLKKFLFQIGTS